MLPRWPHPLRKSPPRKKTNAAKAVVHAVKVAVRAVAKVVAEAAVVAEVVTVQNAVKAEVSAPSAAKAEAKRALPSAVKPAQASDKSAAVNALRTELSVAGSVQNAAKAVVHAKTATAAIAKAPKVKTTALSTHKPVWRRAQKCKPKCVPRPAANAWRAKSAAKKPPQKIAHAPKAVASAALAVRVAVASVPPVKKHSSMPRVTCHSTSKTPN